jgi:signal-transduction protein with cAMP-binding, CBS, and nucleotidyltransferase domain
MNCLNETGIFFVKMNYRNLFLTGKYKMNISKELQNVLFANSLFNGIPKEQVKTFIKSKNCFQVTEGEILYSSNEPSSEIYLVVEGEIKVKFIDNKDIEYKYLSDFFGETEIQLKQKRYSSAIANKNSVLYKISLPELNSLIQTENRIGENFRGVKSSAKSNYSKSQKSIIPDNLINDNPDETIINFDSVSDDLNLS